MAEDLPSIPMAFSPSVSEEPRVRRIKFGDGYEARVLDGLNPISMTTTIPWKNRTKLEATVLVDFFRRHGGHRWFWWVPPNEVARRKFVCPQWTLTRSTDSPAHSPRYDLSAQFYEVHDLGT